MNQSPQTMHGRLLEAVHVSGYSFERACSELEWLLEEDRWMKCGDGFADIRDFLATVDLSPFKIEASHRKRLAKKLQDLEASQRATAKVLGVNEATVNRDLKPVANATSSEKDTPKNKKGKGESVANATSMNGRDAAKAVETKSQVVHTENNSGENEWYTPPEWIEAARRVMGGIDLDPASSETAQENVQAKTFFTIAEDGLSKVWRGRVWMNPPYSRDLCAKFTDKLIWYFNEGEVKQACVLVNNATDTLWLQSLLKSASAVCFPSGRISFLDRSGKPANKPLQGQLIAYLGSRKEEFCTEFETRGAVLFGSCP